MAYFIGVDVGTGSARAGVFDRSGGLLASATHEISIWRPEPRFAQQSSTQIWQAVCASVREAIAAAQIPPQAVAGIGFDATCSLVLVDEAGGPVTVSPKGEADQDVILWADHRATDIAQEIDATGHPLLKITGGRISPEMQLPKLVWLKRSLPDSWAKTAHFFDLPDWLTWRASGETLRSQCSVVCKWTYQGQGPGWDPGFFQAVGLGDLVDEGFRRIGQGVVLPGQRLGQLTEAAAQELGLTPATRVAASMIDAHAGALGTLGLGQEQVRLALIAGTSACHITVGQAQSCVPGVWGPYYGVVFPGLWAHEAGQSMAGAALDTVLNRHSAWETVQQKASAAGQSAYDFLAEYLVGMAQGGAITRLTQDRHILPDFNGNRSPLADPSRLGVSSGQGAHPTLGDLALDYLATLQSLAYGTRQIIERLADNGVSPTEIIVSGGLARNRIYLQTHADVTGCPVLLPDHPEPVLLGAAMLAAKGAGAYETLENAARAMSGSSTVLTPDTTHRDYHDRKYACFTAMQDHFRTLQTLMTSGGFDG